KLGKYNKIILLPEEKKFLKENYQSMTNRQLADALELSLTKTRHFLYEMGLKRMEMEYWTDEQIDFLKKNYKTIGDTELAEIFEKKWPKNKKWTKQRMDKKREYLNLKRTPEELKNIKSRNKRLGRWADCASKMWDTIGRPKVGEIRVWLKSNGEPCKYVRLESGFVPYAPWLYEKEFGSIPEGMCVTFKDRDNMNVVPENLELISRAELSERSIRE